ncbi:RagB/SusD family nutrient uptake outer membrane protein [Segetibacter sp. 3557_3]|uniref:RagB/SusD family nutrient uptake outer membrane protein n=1 Tax=Segetibacter sp. 3557_3 TaxID=2547429 RepID=UPI0010588DEB|nr:RagB/SusD family nutrient uptake outer membrane protein [Segetibacter sp. 3557_3]TDH26581.1 RagB/SusD family nutrient uptake outer membrane protein [Segetibacter sp. 3557_3]
MKKIFIGALLIGLVAGLGSCNKWLELKPQDGIVGNEFWNTKEQVQAAVTGIYSSMQASTSGDRALPEYFFLWGEARADMVAPGFRADQDEQDMVNLNMVATNKYVNWRSFYQTINYCNTVLQLAPGVLQKDPTFSQVQLDQAVGQALSIRALMYFYLVRSFGEVPLKLDATLSDQNIVSIPKSSRDTVLNQIVSDLTSAETKLPLSYGNITTDKGRVTRFAVNAMLADVYLWMDKYTEAVAQCDKVINSGQFGLVNAAVYFNNVFFNGNSSEGIFELQYDVQRLNPFFNMHTPQNRRWGAAQHLTDEVYGVDATNATPIFDVRGDLTSYRGTDFTIWKYVGADINGDNVRSPDQSFANWIFYRYADILLMKAEAINQLDQPLEASRIVKTVRNRAVIGLNTQQNAVDLKTMDSTSKGGMTLFILEERQREFAFEGKRWYDVLRHAKRNNYQQLNLLLNMAAVSISGERRQAAFNKLRDKNSHYFPIYFYEIQTNKLLEQNPFYK